MLPTVRSKRSRHTYACCGDKESDSLKSSFLLLQERECNRRLFQQLTIVMEIWGLDTLEHVTCRIFIFLDGESPYISTYTRVAFYFAFVSHRRRRKEFWNQSVGEKVGGMREIG